MKESKFEEDKELDGFVNMLYGAETSVSQQEFIERVAYSESLNWIFDATEIRERSKVFMIKEN